MVSARRLVFSLVERMIHSFNGRSNDTNSPHNWFHPSEGTYVPPCTINRLSTDMDNISETGASPCYQVYLISPTTKLVA